MIRTFSTKGFVLKALAPSRRIHILYNQDPFLVTSINLLNITRGIKKRKPSKEGRHGQRLSNLIEKSYLDPLESIKPPKSSDNDTSKLFKVCSTRKLFPFQKL